MYRETLSFLLAGAVLASVTLLGIQGTLTGEAVVGVLGAIVGLAGGAAGVRLGARLSNGESPGGSH